MASKEQNDFDRQYKVAVTNILAKNDKALRAIALELFGAIIKDTPVGNPSLWKSKPPPGYVGGRLRGNWQTDVGSPKQGTLDIRDPSGSASLATLLAKSQAFRSGTTIYLTNNLPYAKAIEDGHSKQRPAGMVKVNVVRFQSVVSKVVRSMR